jgi:glycolate oxidase
VAQPIASDIASRLERELGASAVLRPPDEKLGDYGRDESPEGYYPPDCAALCASAEEVAAVLAIAREARVPVTPRGAGSGMTGGCLPLRGGVVLSTERMRRTIEIDGDDLVAVVEPGVITGELQQEVEEAGLFYPPDPASLAFCSIGGNAATNAGGPRAFKYGVTREYVLGLEVALAGGERLRLGRRTAKGVTGYDLVSHFVGAEGTFGVITELTLKLLPRPPALSTLLAAFRDVEGAAAAISALIGDGVRPRVLELADRLAIEHVRGRSRYAFPADAGAIALIELDGDPDGLEATTLRVGERCEEAGALDVRVAQSSSERRALWEARRQISPSLRDAHRHKISEDICVPRSALPEMLRRIDRLAARVDIPIATFGHAGDGNLHVNLLVDANRDDPAVAARIHEAITGLFEETVALRGTLSGEHGIGLSKRDYMHLEQSAALLEWQRRLKRFWDPDEILNPGKVLPPRPAPCTE